MLILIVGVTGNIGQKLIEPLRQRGAQVRGLARHKSKMAPGKLQLLESFHDMEAWHDVPAIRKALQGVDAVICAYGPVPELVLEGQLLLVRLMEEQGISRFMPSAWNLDWTALDWGDIVYYDLFLATQRQLAMSSTIKPFYIFIGFFAETFFSLPGHGVFNPATHGVWDSNNGAPKAEYWGTGDEKWQITTEQEAAEFTAALICDEAREPGVYRYCSWEYSIKEIAAIYEKEKGSAVRLECQGTAEDLKKTAAASQQELGLSRFWLWMGYTYQIHQMSQKTMMSKLDNKLYPDVKSIGLGEFLRMHPEI
ncbi:putative NAD dependent epimerase/dehydratase [Cladophialophora carrionii]|uniref:Putative NAD dependent epimerase/dehydratase n=1 Tax=Cladophialophora carrionii TaxID=86049 RepID=A0A1C1C768_9EURO|nr:putative NAD dependent epimerase/dehydratase [Cladophialophora carrionii]